MVTIKEKKTSHGLPIVFIRNPNLNGVVATLFVRVGSTYESRVNNGISHLLEHLLFQNSFGEQMEKFFPLNLEFNAWTRKDFTAYEISHHKDNLKKIIDVLFACLNNFDFSDKDLERQKRVITREIEERGEEAFTVLGEEMDRGLYKDALGFKIAGEKKSIQKINWDSFKKWYDQFYVPANMVLAISGNFDTNQTFKIINSQDWKRKDNKVNKSYSLPPVYYRKNSNNFSENKNFKQAYLGLAFPTPVRVGDKDYFKHLLLADVLSKQLQLLRKKESDFYDLDFYFHYFLHTGEIRLETSTSKKEANQIMKKLIRQLYNLDLSRNLSEKVKSIIKKQFLLQEDSIDDLSSLAMYKLANNNILTPRQEVQEIGKVKFEDLKKTKHKIINRNNCYRFKLK